MTSSVDALMHAFSRIHRKGIQQASAKMGDQRSGEIRILFALKKASEDGLKVSELSQQLFVTSSFITQVLNGMEEKGWIDRRKDEQDGRVVRVSLTSDGLKKTQELRGNYRKVFQALADHLGEEESRQLADLLQKSFDYIENELS